VPRENQSCFHHLPDHTDERLERLVSEHVEDLDINSLQIVDRYFESTFHGLSAQCKIVLGGEPALYCRHARRHAVDSWSLDTHNWSMRSTSRYSCELSSNRANAAVLSCTICTQVRWRALRVSRVLTLESHTAHVLFPRWIWGATQHYMTDITSQCGDVVREYVYKPMPMRSIIPMTDRVRIGMTAKYTQLMALLLFLDSTWHVDLYHG
jgi:hypothetical protein